MMKINNLNSQKDLKSIKVELSREIELNQNNPND